MVELGTCDGCGATLAILHVTDEGRFCGNCHIAYMKRRHLGGFTDDTEA